MASASRTEAVLWSGVPLHVPSGVVNDADLTTLALVLRDCNAVATFRPRVTERYFCPSRRSDRIRYSVTVVCSARQSSRLLLRLMRSSHASESEVKGYRLPFRCEGMSQTWATSRLEGDLGAPLGSRPRWAGSPAARWHCRRRRRGQTLAGSRPYGSRRCSVMRWSGTAMTPYHHIESDALLKALWLKKVGQRRKLPWWP